MTTRVHAGALAALAIAASCVSTDCPWVGEAEPLPDLVDVDVVYARWVGQFGKPLPKLCRAETPPAFEYEGTAYCEAGAAGCLSTWLGEAFICRAVLLRPAYSGDRCLYMHELTHWLAFCANGSSDTYHTRGELWREGGFLPSACADLASP